MKKLKLFPIFFILIMLQSCSSEKDILPDVKLNAGNELYHFYYVIENNTEKLVAEPIKNLNAVTLREALTGITKKLSEKYDVGFELESLNIIDTEVRDYKIALINISDTGKTMERIHFQGSTGGMHTQTNIMMSLLQPQIDGFLDGCIIHLNNKPVGTMDHVNFEGIINPGVYYYKAKKAIQNK